MKEILEQQVISFGKTIKKIGGEFSGFTIDEVATLEEVKHIESQLNRSLPDDLKNFALTVSRKCEFDWSLPDDFALPDVLDEIFGGGLSFDISSIIDHEEGRVGWVNECFPNANDSYDVIWHNKLAFHHVPNGDYLGFDELGRVVYLSHDDGEGHGYVMANSFSDLMKRWIPLGCPGPEDWQWIPFVSGEKSGILPDCENAKQWLKLINVIP